MAIDHSIFVPEIFDHTIAPEFPPAINGITRRPVPDATLAIERARNGSAPNRSTGNDGRSEFR